MATRIGESPLRAFFFHGKQFRVHENVLLARLPYVYRAIDPAFPGSDQDVGKPNFDAHDTQRRCIVPISAARFSALVDWAYTNSTAALYAQYGDRAYWHRVAVILASPLLVAELERQMKETRARAAWDMAMYASGHLAAMVITGQAIVYACLSTMRDAFDTLRMLLSVVATFLEILVMVVILGLLFTAYMAGPAAYGPMLGETIVALNNATIDMAIALLDRRTAVRSDHLAQLLTALEEAERDPVPWRLYAVAALCEQQAIQAQADAAATAAAAAVGGAWADLMYGPFRLHDTAETAAHRNARIKALTLLQAAAARRYNLCWWHSPRRYDSSNDDSGVAP